MVFISPCLTRTFQNIQTFKWTLLLRVLLCNKMHLVFMGQELCVEAMMQLSPAFINCWVPPLNPGGQKHSLAMSLRVEAGGDVS